MTVYGKLQKKGETDVAKVAIGMDAVAIDVGPTLAGSIQIWFCQTAIFPVQGILWHQDLGSISANATSS